MREYESVYIIQADLDDATIDGIVENIETLIKNSNGVIDKVDRWGKRKLAYPIRKMNEGYYVCVNFKFEPDQVANLKRSLGFNENVLRYIIVKKA